MAVFLAVFWAIVVGLGFAMEPGQIRVHIAAAFFLVVCVLFVHSLVMFYLIGSGRAIREALSVRDWGRPWIRRMRSIRGRCMPAAFFSMLATMGTAWAGAAAHTAMILPATHRWIALSACGLNLVSFVVEFRQLRANSALIAELQRELEGK